MALVSQEQVLWLDVAMSDPFAMHVCNTLEELLEEAQLIVHRKIVPFDVIEQVSLATVFHNVVPAASMGTKASCFHDVRVLEAVGDGELFFDVDMVFFVTHAIRLVEFLDSV